MAPSPEALEHTEASVSSLSSLVQRRRRRQRALDGLGELGRAREALVAGRREGLAHHAVDRRREARDERRRERGIAEEDAEQRVTLVLAVEGSHPGERFVEHHARGVHVGARVHRLTSELLRRHVRDFPFERAAPGDGDPPRCLGDPEVDHPAPPVDADEDVVRDDVAVDDLHRLAAEIDRVVRAVEPGERVEQDAGDERRREPLARGGGRLEQRGERHRLDVRLHEEDLSSAIDDVVHGHHVRVADLRGEPGLVEEHVGELAARGEVGMEALDHHQALEARRAAVEGELHRAHAACRQLEEYAVTAEIRIRCAAAHQNLPSSESDGRGEPAIEIPARDVVQIVARPGGRVAMRVR